MCARYWKVKMGKTPSVRVSKEPRRHSEKKGILGAGEAAQLLAAQEWGGEVQSSSSSVKIWA